MNEISSFLWKIKNKIGLTSSELAAAAEAVSQATNASIPLKNIEIKNNIVYIKSSSTAKNEIFLKKSVILEKINQTRRTSAKILDIR